MKTLRLILSFLIFVIAISCSSVKEHAMNVTHLEQVTTDSKHGIYYADFDATKRGAIILHDKNADANAIRILAEPPPDAALAFAKSFAGNLAYEKIDVGMASALSETLEKLTNKTTSINFLRDALYRLNEYDFNRGLNKDDYKSMFDNVLSASKKIAEAELEKAKLETAKEESKIAIEQTKQIEKSAAFNRVNTFPIYFHVSKKEDREKSNKMVSYLNKLGFISAGTEQIDYTINKSQIRYFNDEDKDLAQSILDNLTNAFKDSDFEIKKTNLNKTVALGRVEVWLK